MGPRDMRIRRARELVEDTLGGYPSGLPGIELVDRLEWWGYSVDEGMALLSRLQNEGRLRIERGRYTLSE